MIALEDKRNFFPSQIGTDAGRAIEIVEIDPTTANQKFGAHRVNDEVLLHALR